MSDRKKSRPPFTAEEKLAVLHMRQLLDPEMPVTTLCRKVGITPKTYYEWEKAYAANGLNGLKPVKRSPYGEAAISQDMVATVLSTARQQPCWSSTKLHAEISRLHRISHYALRRILAENGLDSVESRIGAVEQAIVRGDVLPVTDKLNALFRENPCLEDWFRMGERPRYPIGLHAIPLGRRSALRGHYLVLAIDFDSLYVCGALIRGKHTGSGMDFLASSMSRFRRSRGTRENLVIFGNMPNSIIREDEQCEIQIFDNSNSYILSECSGKSCGAITVVDQKVRATLLPQLREILTIEEAQLALARWLEQHNDQPGSPKYPTFGRKPGALVSEHTRPPIRSVPVDIQLHNRAAEIRKRRMKEDEPSM